MGRQHNEFGPVVLFLSRTAGYQIIATTFCEEESLAWKVPERKGEEKQTSSSQGRCANSTEKKNRASTAGLPPPGST